MEILGTTPEATAAQLLEWLTWDQGKLCFLVGCSHSFLVAKATFWEFMYAKPQQTEVNWELLKRVCYKTKHKLLFLTSLACCGFNRRWQSLDRGQISCCKPVLIFVTLDSIVPPNTDLKSKPWLSESVCTFLFLAAFFLQLGIVVVSIFWYSFLVIHLDPPSPTFLSPCTGSGGERVWFHAHNLDPTHVQMKFHALTHQNQSYWRENK